jgi:uncharacterized protein YqhQ
MPEPLPNYGGQALIEGVMMRGQKACAMAARGPNQSIVVETEHLSPIYSSPIAKIPFLRGLIMLWDTLVLGMRALTFSANLQMGEDERLEGAPLTLTVLFSLLAGAGIFFLIPAGAGYMAQLWLHLDYWGAYVVEGISRLALLVGYIWAIGLLPDVRRVYGYHGAEHQTINAFEDGAELSVDSIRSYPREHPRCGTAFLLTVVVFSILLFSALGPLSLWARFVSRLLLIPVLASLAYECIRLSAEYSQHWLARALISPNLALQRLTTREPDDGMIEVAVQAFTAMLAEETAEPHLPAERAGWGAEQGISAQPGQRPDL